jgi:hypothetical protein
MNVNLNECVAGQKLRGKHGLILTYVGVNRSAGNSRFPHEVKYPNGSHGTRTDDGFVYSNLACRMEIDEDIVEILPLN